MCFRVSFASPDFDKAQGGGARQGWKLAAQQAQPALAGEGTVSFLSGILPPHSGGERAPGQGIVEAAGGSLQTVAAGWDGQR